MEALQEYAMGYTEELHHAPKVLFYGGKQGRECVENPSHVVSSSANSVQFVQLLMPLSISGFLASQM